MSNPFPDDMYTALTSLVNYNNEMNSNLQQALTSLTNIESALASTNAYLSTIEEALTTSEIIGQAMPLPVDQV